MVLSHVMVVSATVAFRVQTRSARFIFAADGWHVQPGEEVYDPQNATIIYRRRKAKPEPADDGPKFETVVTSLEVTMQGKILYKVWLDGDLVGVAVDGDDDSIMISPSSWPALRAAIDRLIGECRE